MTPARLHEIIKMLRDRLQPVDAAIELIERPNQARTYLLYA